MPTSRPIRSLLYLLFGVCPLLFFTDVTRNPYYTQIALLNVFIPACWILWLYESLKAGELEWVTSSFDLPLLSLTGICLVSWLASMGVNYGLLKPIYSEGSKAMIFLLVNSYLVYAAALRLRDATLFRRILWITYGVCFLASAYGVMQYFGLEIIWPSTLNPYGYRPVSTFGNPNFMSSFLIVVIPVMIADFIFRATKFPRGVLFITILVSLGALLSTLTRSSWGGLFVGIIILGLGTGLLKPAAIRENILLWISILLLVLLWPEGGSVAYHPTVVDRLLEVKRAAHEVYGSAYQRFLIWLAAWHMAQDCPVLGRGWGCFELFYPMYQGTLLFEKTLSLRTHANNAHNEILEYWSQIGTLGLGVVVWMWTLFFRKGVSIAKRITGPWQAMQWGFLGGVAGMLVDNLLNVSVHFAVPALIFWWWVGSAMSMDSTALRLRKIELHSIGKKMLAGLCITGLTCLMVRSFCMWEEEFNFFKGFKLSKGGVDLTSASRYLESAYQWHHLEVNNNYELGNVYARMGDKANALRMYKLAIDANAGYDEIYFNRATLLNQTGYTDEAIANYKICLAINPLSQQAYNALAAIYFKNFATYANAIGTLYRQGVELFPNDKDMWNNLGYFYTQNSQLPQAADAYEHAIRLDPQFGLAQRNLAVVQQKLNAISKH